MCIAHAEASGAFSLQDLAWWINETAIPCYRRIKWLNAMARSWWLRQRVDSPKPTGEINDD